MTVSTHLPHPHLPTGSIAAARDSARSGSLAQRLQWPLGLTGLGVAMSFITLWGLANSSRSEYYAAIVKSMSLSWSNFFFGSFDPAGTVTLDKIPGSYWIPALSAKIFGFSTWSIELPNALAAIGAALITAVAIRRLAGNWAGLFAGLIVGSTPILIAVSRSNQPESFFVLALAAALWAAIHATQKASLGWLIAAGVGIGLAFQCYMLEAWALWPALIAAYLCTRQPWMQRLWHLAVAGAISLAVSLTWIIIVSLVPVASRPFIGSTKNNTPWEMVFGYNGLGRFSATSDSSDYNSFTPPFSGSAGVFRLFNEQVAGQIAWLIPAAIAAIVILAVLRFHLPTLVLLGGMFGTYVVMFSAVAGMHQFYVASLALPIAALVATGFGVARQQRVLWAQLTLLGIAALTAIVLSLVYSSYLPWLAWLQGLLAIAAAAVILAEHFQLVRPQWWAGLLIAVSMVLTPLGWSLGTIGHTNSTNPIAGPNATNGMTMSGMGGAGGQGGFGGRGNQGGSQANGGPRVGGQGGPGAMSGQNTSGSTAGRGAAGGTGQAGGTAGASDSSNTAIIDYVTANRNGAKFLLATFGAQAAASYITATGDNILPIGGFSGSDSVPTLDAFTQLVASGQLRYVLMSSSGMGAASQFNSSASDTAASQIKTWVQANCTAVTADGISSGTLYECSAS